MVPREMTLKGEVGKEEDNGCKLMLRSYDFTGNRCVDGGVAMSDAAARQRR